MQKCRPERLRMQITTTNRHQPSAGPWRPRRGIGTRGTLRGFPADVPLDAVGRMHALNTADRYEQGCERGAEDPGGLIAMPVASAAFAQANARASPPFSSATPHYQPATGGENAYNRQNLWYFPADGHDDGDHV